MFTSHLNCGNYELPSFKKCSGQTSNYCRLTPMKSSESVDLEVCDVSLRANAAVKMVTASAVKVIASVMLVFSSVRLHQSSSFSVWH